MSPHLLGQMSCKVLKETGYGGRPLAFEKWRTGKVLEDWKRGNVILLFKKEKTDYLGNNQGQLDINSRIYPRTDN